MRYLVGCFVAALMLVSSPAFATDCSGTIASGGTAQDAVVSSNIRSLIFANNSAHLMCIAFDGTAAIAGTNCEAGSYALAPGSATTAGGFFATFSGFTVTRVSVVASGTGDRYSCSRQ